MYCKTAWNCGTPGNEAGGIYKVSVHGVRSWVSVPRPLDSNQILISQQNQVPCAICICAQIIDTRCDSGAISTLHLDVTITGIRRAESEGRDFNPIYINRYTLASSLPLPCLVKKVGLCTRFYEMAKESGVCTGFYERAQGLRRVTPSF
jgi:hypothetical protein